VSAIEAAMQTGIRPPMLYYSDFVAVLGELFRRHNNRRGHGMQGFDRIRVPHPNNGGMMFVSESPNDKAGRMFAKMELEGRKITRPNDKDIFLLLHKVARVMVSANGAVVTIDGKSIRLFACNRARNDTPRASPAAKKFSWRSITRQAGCALLVSQSASRT
jgi:hypothetical protein